MRHVLGLVLPLLLIACGREAPSIVTLYCYETLADAACYLAPDKGREKRLLAVVDVPLTRALALRKDAAADH